MNSQYKLNLSRQRKWSFESTPARHGSEMVPDHQAPVAQTGRGRKNLKRQVITASSGQKGAHRSIKRPGPRVVGCGCKSRLRRQAHSAGYVFGAAVAQSQSTAQSRVSTGLKRSCGRVVNRVEPSGFERRTQIVRGQASPRAVANFNEVPG